MRKLYNYLACILLASTLCSCVQDLTEDIHVNISNGEVVYAKLKEGDRAQLSTDMKMSWLERDTIYVIGPGRFCAYAFDGKTGARGGTFTAIPDLNLYEKNITYKTVIDNIGWSKYYDNKYYAITPYGGFSSIGDQLILYIPKAGMAKQYYNPNGCDPKSFVLFGVSDDGVNFEFENLLGFIHIKLTGSKTVKDIVLTENTESADIAGRFGFYLDEPTVSVWGTKSNSVTLDCGEGVQLRDIPTDFIFSVRPVEFEEGFTLVVNFTDGSKFIQRTSKSIIMKRNTVQPMATINVDGIEFQTLTVSYSTSSVVVPEFSGTTDISGYIDWGDGNFSVLGLVTSYDYVDLLESHNVTINVRNAQKVKFNSIYGISAVDLSNF